MAKATSSKMTSQTATPSAAEVEALLARNGRTLEAMIKANGAVLEGMAKLGREMLEFGNTRIREDLEASETLMKCKDPQEAFRLQCDFARRATQQYFEEATRLMELTAQITRNCWAPLEETARAGTAEPERAESAPAPKAQAKSQTQPGPTKPETAAQPAG